jgi:hypothetical protein
MRKIIVHWCPVRQENVQLAGEVIIARAMMEKRLGISGEPNIVVPDVCWVAWKDHCHYQGSSKCLLGKKIEVIYR